MNDLKMDHMVGVHEMQLTSLMICMAIGFFLDEQCAISVRSDKYQIYSKCFILR